MTMSMTNERPRSLVGRLRNLIHGIVSVWVRDGERNNPRAVYEQAISERTKQYRDLKEAVAGILYMRNKLEAEITERRADVARLHDDIRRSVRRGDDEASVTLIAHKQTLMEELERTEQELDLQKLFETKSGRTSPQLHGEIFHRGAAVTAHRGSPCRAPWPDQWHAAAR